MGESELLDRLAAALRRPGMPTQTAISRDVGVDQPMVSRALHGELKRVTPRVRRLCEYAERKAGEIDRLHATQMRRSGRWPSLALEAMTECRNYLKDGCDPGLLRDQLKVLRRAQGRP